MKAFNIFIFFTTGTLVVGEISNPGQCESPQYIEFSTTAVIKCHFEWGVFAILWFNSTDYSGESFIHYKNNVKSGFGLTSGEFDIMENGSLIIGNVSLRHDHYFTAVKLNSSNDDFIPNRVLAIVSVTPNVAYPQILKCGSGRSVCYVEINVNESCSCEIRGSRPEIPLKWLSRTAHGDINVTSYTNASSEGIIFSTFASANRIFSNHPDLLLLVCKATRDTPLLRFHESMILVKNKFEESLISSSVTKTFHQNTEVKLTCTGKNSSFLVWMLKHGETKGFDIPLAIFINSETIEGSLLTSYHVDHEGSLVIPNFKLHQEGVYHCLYGNGLMSGIQRYQVTAYVPPVPPHPVVDGCLHQDYCELKKGSEGKLTCRLFGIRPEAHLEWYVVPRSMHRILTFSHYSRQKIPKDGVFDIVLTAKYRLNDKSHNRVTVECKGSLANEPLTNFSAKADLFFANALAGNETLGDIATDNTLQWTISTIATVVIVFNVFLVAVCFYKRDRRNRQETRQTAHLILPTMKLWANIERISDIKQIFIEEITPKYKKMCAAVQPVPFLPRRLLDIDVFVEGGIEYLHGSNNQFGKEKWERLGSFTDIFTDEKLKSKRYILEAEAGYGKSTLCLQLVHDWYSEGCSSSLHGFELLIFLSLRQVKEGMSLVQAIRHMLLPQDSKLSENDVRTILSSCSSVLLLLDGYDEYINTCNDTEITKIMEREIFQSFHVILTMRPHCIPAVLTPHATRLRLIGFDEIARNKYISKAVVNNVNSKFQRLKNRLSVSPIIQDLWQNPLFFVMFAHLAHEEEALKTNVSATSFFRYTVTCMYTHWRNKDSEQFSPLELCDHNQLDKLAFDSLAKGQQTVWERENMIDEIGKETFEELFVVGILRQEEDYTTEEVPQFVQVMCVKKVTFCHDVFREWFAAHHLAKISSETDDLHLHLNHHDPLDLQYMFRFACGLNRTARESIMKYFKRIRMCNGKN